MEGRLTALLRALVEAQVEFILVGGLSAVIEGTPIHTYDVDIVHHRNEKNNERLRAVVAQLELEQRLRLKISEVLGYEELLEHSHRVELGDGLNIAVLDLNQYILFKEELGGEKDRAVLPVLRRTLMERQRG